MFKRSGCSFLLGVVLVLAFVMMVSAQTSDRSALLAEKKKQLAEMEKAIVNSKDLVQAANEFGVHALQAFYLKQKTEELNELTEVRNVLKYEVDFLSKVASNKQNGMIINSLQTDIVTPTPSKEEIEKKAAAELKAKQEAEAARLAAEKKAKEEAEKKAAELKAKQEAEAAKLAAEKKAKEEADKKAAEAAKLSAAELKAKQEAEAAKLAAEKKAKEEAEKKAAAELKAKQEAEKKAAAELKAKQEAEAARLAAEKKAKEEAEKKAAAELKAKQEAEAARLAAEKKAKQEAEKKAAELKAKQEAEAAKLAAEKKAKEEAEKKAAAELKAKQEAEKKAAAELKAKQEAEKKKAEFTIEAACDNSYTLYVNGQKVISGSDWGTKQVAKKVLNSGDLITVKASDLDAYGGLLVQVFNDKGQQFSSGSSTWRCKVGSHNVAGDEFLNWPVAVKAPHSDNYGVAKKPATNWIWTKTQQKGAITCAQRISF